MRKLILLTTAALALLCALPAYAAFTDKEIGILFLLDGIGDHEFTASEDFKLNSTFIEKDVGKCEAFSTSLAQQPLSEKAKRHIWVGCYAVINNVSVELANEMWFALTKSLGGERK